MKKYLNLILAGCGLVLALIVFGTMAGAGLTLDGGKLGSASTSIYDMMGGKVNNGIAVACLIMVIVGALLNAVVVVTDVLKKYNKYNKLIALLSAVVLLVGGIMFFTLTSGDAGKVFELGVGAIFSGILAILSAVCIGARGALEFLKK